MKSKVGNIVVISDCGSALLDGIVDSMTCLSGDGEVLIDTEDLLNLCKFGPHRDAVLDHLDMHYHNHKGYVLLIK